MDDLIIFALWSGFMLGFGCIIWGLERIEKAIKALR